MAFRDQEGFEPVFLSLAMEAHMGYLRGFWFVVVRVAMLL